MTNEPTSIPNFLRQLKVNLYSDWKILVFLLSVPLLLSFPLYFFENGVHGSKITSWPESIYLTWITLMTIGYGDISPITFCGRLIACIDAVFGVVLFGLVVALISKARDR
jgi:hypothetical protein